jgi:hypothetical protein
VGDEMPADPFREGQLDWGPLAANNFAFFSAHLAAGFSEGQALELTARYLSFVVGVIFANQAEQQQDPGDV